MITADLTQIVLPPGYRLRWRVLGRIFPVRFRGRWCWREQVAVIQQSRGNPIWDDHERFWLDVGIVETWPPTKPAMPAGWEDEPCLTP